MKIPFHIKIVIAIVVLLTVMSVSKSIYTDVTTFFNVQTTYQLEYKQLEEQQLTTFDNNYLIFKDNCAIADLNKETFIKVTEIIFTARTDGENVAWKWVHENQQVDYDVFSRFYADLSTFTKERYKDNNYIEGQKQTTVKLHNLGISTFPGVIYNYFIHIKPLEYTTGFLTKETKELFNK